MFNWLRKKIKPAPVEYVAVSHGIIMCNAASLSELERNLRENWKGYSFVIYRRQKEISIAGARKIIKKELF